MPARAWHWSILARQVDYAVGEVQRDFIQRKIGVLDILGEHDVAVAVVAGQRRRLLPISRLRCQFPQKDEQLGRMASGQTHLNF